MFKRTLIALTLATTLGIALGLSPLAQAEPVGGPKYNDVCITAYGEISYTQVLYGSEPSTTIVAGSGTTLLTLSVYDTYGNLLATSTAYDPSVTVLPYWTQQMTIVVTNQGSNFNCYSMLVV